MNNNIFKKTALCAFIAAMATGCGSSSSSSDAETGVNTFAVGSIAKVGEVDWYEYQTTEANQTISLTVTSNTVRPDIELLVGAHIMKDGKKELLYADHSPEGNLSTSKVDLDLVIDEPQTVYFSVRDLRDDEADENDTYSMKLDVATTDGTSSFEDAISMSVTSDPSCQEDVIGDRGDLDTFKLVVTESGVYHIVTNFNRLPDTEVNLLVGLYDENGAQLKAISKSEAVNSGKTYPIIAQLNPGTYYILAQDYSNEYFDLSATYEICTSKSIAAEAGVNDTKDTATALVLGQAYEGSLEYDGDEDWYEASFTAAVNGDVKILNVNLDTSAADDGYQYDLIVRDADDNIVLTHKHNAGSKAYDVELKVDGNGPYYITVLPNSGLIYNTNSDGDALAQAPYILTVNAEDVTDQYEAGDANNTQLTAALIDSGVTINGKIAYRTDTDYYTITVPGNEPKILEVYLATENQESGGAVDYSVAIIGSGIDGLLNDDLGSDAPTSLKTAMITPERNDGGNHTYYIRVRDLADDESNAISGYSLMAEVKDINDSVVDFGDITAAVYHSELDEQTDLKARTTNEKLAFVIQEPTNEYNDVEDYFMNLPNMDREFSDDQATLVFDGDNKHADFTRTDNEDGTVTFVTPWQAGYVDYQGDQDYFKLKISALLSTAYQKDELGENVLDEAGDPILVEQDTNWYYDIKVELAADESDVEYVWKLHTDTNNDRKIGNNGIYASSGDTSAETDAIGVIVSGGDPDSFWMSEYYDGTYYFKISDNNLMTSANNMFAEADWSQTKPYYFRITLTYHGGVSRYVSE